MVHALAAFVQERAEKNGWGPTDLAGKSGLSKQLCWNWLHDDREKVARLPEPATIAGFKEAFRVSTEFLLGKAIESLGLGYSSGDFINDVTTATNRELLDEIQRRLDERGEERAGSAPIAAPPTPLRPAARRTEEKTEGELEAEAQMQKKRQARRKPKKHESPNEEEGSA